MKTKDLYLGIATAAATAIGLMWWSKRAKGATNLPSYALTPSGNYLPVYKPHSPEAIALFTEAARRAGLPTAWGSDIALHMIVAKESLGGYVGIPNYQFGEIAKPQNRDRWWEVWAALKSPDKDAWRTFLAEPWRSGPRGRQSSATGLGQLTTLNIDKGIYYPSNRQGIGNAMEEAMGMLRYIALTPKYGTPQRAWDLYGEKAGPGHEGY